jgi:hypothetical protein
VEMGRKHEFRENGAVTRTQAKGCKLNFARIMYVFRQRWKDDAHKKCVFVATSMITGPVKSMRRFSGRR